MQYSHEDTEDFSDTDAPTPVDPLEIIPTEMWVKVLNNLEENPRDLHSSSEVCSLFGAILSEKLNGRYLEVVIPLVLQYLPKNDILNCRLISKGITNTVDGVLKKVEMVAPFRHLNLYRFRTWMPPKPSPFVEWIRFGTLRHTMNTQLSLALPKDLHFIRNYMENKCWIACGLNKARKSVWRKLSLRIELDNSERCQICLEKLLEIMKMPMFCAIQFIEVDCIFAGPINATLAYKTSRKILNTLSNLVGFTMCICCSACPNLSPGSILQLQDYIFYHPLPEMQFLRHIAFRTSCPVAFVQEISRQYGDQLTSLEMVVNEPTMVCYSFPEITHLKITKPICCQYLPKYHSPKVLRLEIKFFPLRRGHQQPFPLEMRPFLKDFKNLTSLVFSRDTDELGIFVLFISPSGERNLKAHKCPNIKHLKAESVESFKYSPKMFFAAFPGLETFEINFSNPLVSEMMRDFSKDWKSLYEGRGYEVDIWKRCRSLNVLQVSFIDGYDQLHCNIYTRKGSQLYQQNLLNKKSIFENLIKTDYPQFNIDWTTLALLGRVALIFMILVHIYTDLIEN